MRISRGKTFKKISAIIASFVMISGVFSGFGNITDVYAGNSHLLNDSASKAGIPECYVFPMDEARSNTRNKGSSYHAETPYVVTLLDNNNNINVAYLANGNLYIQKFKSDMSLGEMVEIPFKYPLFGNITCDQYGYYYVAWGQNDNDIIDCVTICISKYDSKGKLVKELALHGTETKVFGEDEMGTREPFYAGNCSIAIQNGVVAVNYARKMYGGHQSSLVIYADTSSMERKYGSEGYVSHSFDQRIYALSDGKFGILNQGDVYPRSFTVEVGGFTASGGWRSNGLSNFHFREGTNRDYGYNETFAQLGGLAEINSGYVFAATSSRELSLNPRDVSYRTYDINMDLFIQILKKDFYNYSHSDMYVVPGEVRYATGEKPSSANTKLCLTGDEVNEGIIWLTAYDNMHFAANPKVVSLDNNKFAVLWEKRGSSEGYKDIETYYAVIDGNGGIVVNTTRLYDCLLAFDTDPVVRDGKIYWAIKNYDTSCLYCLDPMKKTVEPYITLNKDTVSLIKGETVKLEATLVPGNARTKAVEWTTSDNDIADIDKDGTVTAISEGTAVITAKFDNKTASCTVKVKEIPLKSISISSGDFSLENPGDKKKLTVNCYPADTTDSKDVVWSTSDKNIARISKDGTVEAYRKGTATITATVGEKTASVNVTVNTNKCDYFNFYVSPTDMKLKIGEYNEIKHGYSYSVGYDEAVIKWSSSDESVVTVDKWGGVTGEGTGKAVITAELDGLTATCNVVVEGKTDYIKNLDCKWFYSNKRYYWYEGGIKQGTYDDPQGVIGDGTVRGREIYDPESDGWYWLDSVYAGAKAIGKEVWMPYIYQNEDTWNDEDKRSIAYESDEGMGESVYRAIVNKSGKWVRYDEYGKMLKGWITIEGELAEKYPDQVGKTYYYDTRTGLMAKGLVTIDGVNHYFNETTGVFEW